MTYKILEEKLINYTNNSEDPETNFWLAVEYDKLDQTSSAVSLYLRCLERSKDKNLQYESLILSGLCFKRQGDRIHSEKSCWQNAIYLLPERPEAYLFMADVFTRWSQHHTALSYICIGEQMSKNEEKFPPFRIDISQHYSGSMQFKMKRILASKQCGINYLPEPEYNFVKTLDIVEKTN